MGINKRIERLRMEQGLSMADFGKRIGISAQAISSIEKGVNNPSDRTIMLICREFGINEEWLKEGTGEVFAPVDDQTAAVVSDLLDNDNPLYNVILETVRIYQTLDDRSKDVINDFVDRLLEAKEG